MLLLSIVLAFVAYPFIRCEVINDPTLKPGSLIMADDARTLDDENKDKVANVMCHRTYDERKQLETFFNDNYCTYSNEYREKVLPYTCTLEYLLDLISTDDLDKLYNALLLSPDGILADSLSTLINQNGKNRLVVEIICAEDNPMKARIKNFYAQNLETTLEQHIATYKKDDIPYQEAIMKYCVTERPQELRIVEQIAIDEANVLRQINIETDQEPFKTKLKEFLDKYTDADMKLIFQKYRDNGADGIGDTVESVFGGDEKEIYSTLVRYIENQCRYYADALHDCLDGVGTDEARLNRIVVTRCERDLGCIHKEYKSLHGVTYTERLDDDTSNDRYLECIRYLSGKP